MPASKTGITFQNTIVPNVANRYNLIAYPYFYNGGGVALDDFNQDGKLDVFLTGNQVNNRLYLNKGDWTFEDVSQKAGITGGKWSTGTTVADVNADGLPDIYVCNAGPLDENERIANQLYINNGDGTFSEKAKEYGVAGNEFSTQASFFDYDQDGDLDLIVMNHSFFWRIPAAAVKAKMKKDKNMLKRISPNLYRNDGNGTFSDVTVDAGLLNYSYGLGLVTADINNDGWTDFYVANDFDVPDFMYINNQDGTFSDKIKEYTNQISWFGMGCDIADINNDALLDISVVDMTAADHVRSKTLMASMDSKQFWEMVNEQNYQYQYMFNTFQLNNGNGSFSNIASLTGMDKTDWSWATLMADYDNDGDKDNYVTNGYRKYSLDNDYKAVYNAIMDKYGKKVPVLEREKLYAQIPEIPLPNVMYENKGDLQFENVAKDWGLAQSSYSNGAAYGDLDNDGDLDLVVNNIDAAAFVYKNNTSGKNFLRIKLEGKEKGASVLNAKVKIIDDGKIQYQELTRTRGYQSAMEPLLHFGLNNSDEVNEVMVIWPDGTMQIEKSVPANELLIIKQKDGLPKHSFNTKTTTLFAEQKQDYFTHKENSFDDFAREILLPHRQSQLGPLTAVGDVNGDKRDDFYVGGAKDQSGKLFIQTASGTFKPAADQPWKFDAACEDMGACFFDMDNDGDLDLYIASGGNEFDNNSPQLKDRLYKNDGNGNFKKTSLPSIPNNSFRVKASDYDGDGDQDLLVSGRAEAGRYPFPAKTTLFINDGKGGFTDETKTLAPGLEKSGIVTDFVWLDINGDEQLDLVTVGEWMPIQFYENNKGVLSKSKTYDKLQGWWYSLAAEDMDGDGDKDLVVGNIGLNNKFHPTTKKPLHIYCNDFDESGSFDIVLSKEYNGELVPTRGRECSSQQMPFIIDKFPTYKDFANANIEEMYGKDKLGEAVHGVLNETHSIILWNDGGDFTPQNLPIQAQMAPVNGIVLKDVNNDDKMDIVIAGNMYQAEVETQRYDAGTGGIFLNKGNQEFTYLSPVESGFSAPDDVKDVQAITIGNQQGLIVTNNDGALQLFRLNINKLADK